MTVVALIASVAMGVPWLIIVIVLGTLAMWKANGKQTDNSQCFSLCTHSIVADHFSLDLETDEQLVSGFSRPQYGWRYKTYKFLWVRTSNVRYFIHLLTMFQYFGFLYEWVQYMCLCFVLVIPWSPREFQKYTQNVRHEILPR